VDGSHVAGAGVGGIAGVVVAALGSKIGLHLDDTTAATLGLGAVGVGLAFGHAFGKAWTGQGVFPSIRRGLFGPKKSAHVVVPAASPAAAKKARS
jgi:hypothetical protein